MKKIFILLVAIILALTNACRKQEPVDPENIRENKDFYAFMKDWYYWNKTIPEIDPAKFRSVYEVLEAIRNNPLDRWSYIADWQEFLAFYQESRLIGYGFGSSWDSGGSLRVAFVHNTTEIFELGVRRGWIIERINGTLVTQGANISQMLGANQIGVSNTLTFRKPDNTIAEFTVAKKEVFANTVLHHQIFEYPDRKIGYLVLQSFREPTDNELRSVFSAFSAAGVTDLILDMRYNGGGMVSVAGRLASLIAGPTRAGLPFVRFEYNDNKAGQNNTTLNLSNIENSLGLNRLVTICTRASASASELVINGLRPFINVTIVGSATYGKPMGANIFNYGNKYAFAPITFKTKNANNEGDYFNGLPANIAAPDDLSRNFGDPLESSLQAALHFLVTGIAKSFPVQEPKIRQPWEDMQGLRWESRMH